jgi:hypothetical protein
VFALINTRRDMSRLLMLFAGCAAFYALPIVAVGWTPGLLMLAAGLGAFALAATRQTKLLKDEPREKVKGKMLIIAAVLAILYGGYQAFNTYVLATFYAAYGVPQYSTYYFFIGFANVIGCIGLAAVCFMKNRPTSVFYRMFFVGAILNLTLQIPLKIISALQNTEMNAYSYVQSGTDILVLIILVLVLLHAIRTRSRKVMAETDAELEEALGEEDDEEDSTIGHYKEDDDDDSTIGLYKEDDADGESPDEDK